MNDKAFCPIPLTYECEWREDGMCKSPSSVNYEVCKGTAEMWTSEDKEGRGATNGLRRRRWETAVDEDELSKLEELAKKAKKKARGKFAPFTLPKVIMAALMTLMGVL